MTSLEYTNTVDGLCNDFINGASTEREFKVGMLDLLIKLRDELLEKVKTIESHPVEPEVSLQGAVLKTKYRFINFVEGLKDEWTVWTNKGDECLGIITYHKKWKEWEFAPEAYTGFTKQCLLDLVDFIKQLKAPQSN